MNCTKIKVRTCSSSCKWLARKDTGDILGERIENDVPPGLNIYKFKKLFYENNLEKIDTHLKHIHITPGSKRHIEVRYEILYKIHYMAREKRVSQKDLFTEIIKEFYPSGSVLSMRKNLSDVVEQASNNYGKMLEQDLAIKLDEYKIVKPSPEEYLSLISEMILKDKNNIIIAIEDYNIRQYYNELEKKLRIASRF